MIDWQQMGQDFQQKYEGTYCRYTSPISGAKEVFRIGRVVPSAREAPTIVIFNKKHGELYLKYDTEAELDFTFPACGYFEHDGMALIFERLYQRQWKKGLCTGTASILFPYPNVTGEVYFTDDAIASAYAPAIRLSISDGIKALEQKKKFSVPLSKTLALGLSNKEGKYWLWYESEPIAEVEGLQVNLKVPQFRQEVSDHCRDTGDYARSFV